MEGTSTKHFIITFYAGVPRTQRCVSESYRGIVLPSKITPVDAVALVVHVCSKTRIRCVCVSSLLLSRKLMVCWVFLLFLSMERLRDKHKSVRSDVCRTWQQESCCCRVEARVALKFKSVLCVSP